MKSKKNDAQAELKILFVGIDWATQEHALCLINADGEQVEVLAQDPEDIANWIDSLGTRFPGHRVLIALEQSRGALMAALSGASQLELYPINPKQLANYRKAIVPSGAKDDPGDARLLARFLQFHYQELRRWQPDCPQTQKIAELSVLRRKLVDGRKRLVLQLGSSLVLYFPLIKTLLFGRTLHHALTLDLLLRWPTLEKLKRVHPKTLRLFLKNHGLKNKDQQKEFIESIRGAVALTKDKSLIEPRAMYVQSLVGQLKDLNLAIAEFDRELRQWSQSHPDYELFHSLPGAGDALTPRLIAAFGSDRDRYELAEEIQSYSGIAPISRKSGKSQGVFKRLDCPTFLRQTFHEFADQTLKWSRWANAFYRMKRAAGMKHHAAVRALAFKWIRILFRLWKTHTPYNEALYIQQLTLNNSPIIPFLKPE
jgi:transposase